MIEKEFTYKSSNRELIGCAKESSFIAGKAVFIEIFNEDGSVWNAIKFACHPEFKDYHYYENLDISELIDVAIARVCSGEFDTTFDEMKYKVILLYKFNSNELNL